MIKFIVVYIILGSVSFYFGNITPELAALGISEPIVSIISKGLDAAVKGAGMIGAGVFGLTQLPNIKNPPAPPGAPVA